MPRRAGAGKRNCSSLPSWTTVGRGPVRRALGRRAARREHVEPAHGTAHRREPRLPARWRAAGRAGRGAPHRVRPGHRAAELSALRRRRLLARADLGAVDGPHRGGPARRRPPRARGRRQRAFPPPLRGRASPRTSTRSPVRGCAIAPTRGRRAPTCCSRARHPSVRRRRYGDGGDGERVSWRNLAETVGMASRDPSGIAAARRASRMDKSLIKRRFNRPQHS